MDIAQFLHTQVPFLTPITAEQSRLLAEAIERKTFALGQTIVFQGATVEGLHVVAKGKVQVFGRSKKTKAAVLIAELGIGEVFGETSMLEMGVAGATIKAASGGAEIFVIPEASFRGLIQENQELTARLSVMAADRKSKACAILDGSPGDLPSGNGAPS